MTAIAKKLEARLNRWAPETAKKVKQLVAGLSKIMQGLQLAYGGYFNGFATTCLRWSVSIQVVPQGS